MPLVVVEWHDAKSSGGWGDREAYLKIGPAPILTAGFLLAKTRKKVQIVQSYDVEDGQLLDSIQIPRAWIVSIRRVRVPRAR